MGHSNLLASLNGDCSFVKSQQQQLVDLDHDPLNFEFEEPTSVLDLSSCISPPLQVDVWTEQKVQYLLEEQHAQAQHAWEQQQQQFLYWEHQQQLLRSSWEYQEQNKLQAEQISLLASSMGEQVGMVWEVDEYRQLQEPGPADFDSWGFHDQSASDLSSFEGLSSSTLPHLAIDDEFLNMESWIYGSDGSSITDDHDSSTALIDLDESSSSCLNCSIDAASSSYDDTPMNAQQLAAPISIQQQHGSVHIALSKKGNVLQNSLIETAIDNAVTVSSVEDSPCSLMIPCLEQQAEVSSFEICPIASSRPVNKVNLPMEAQKQQWLQSFPETEFYPPHSFQPLMLHPDLAASDVYTPPSSSSSCSSSSSSSSSHQIHLQTHGNDRYQWDQKPAVAAAAAAGLWPKLSSPNLTGSLDFTSTTDSTPWQSFELVDFSNPNSSPSSGAGTFHGGMITQLDIPQGVGRMGVETRNARARMDADAAAGVDRASPEQSYKISSNSETHNGGVQMVQLLLACAEAVACRDSRQAAILLQQLQHMASPYGDSMQRVTSCFVEGLTARLSATGSQLFDSSNPPRQPPNDMEKDEGFQLTYRASPYVAFGHYAANSSILEAFEGEPSLHIVDLGMTHSLQWPYLINRLSTRSCGPPRLLRITAYGLATAKMEEAGRELTECAKLHKIPFEFRVVTDSLENLQRSMLKLREGEALAVNSMLQLHCVVKESRGSLNAVLQSIHELGPKILTLVEQNASHNGPFFLGRFMEALHYYSAIFDSLDAILPRYSHQRVKMEQFHFAEEIKNIVSCEGPARVERHERIDQWRRRMSRAGYQPLPLKFLNKARMWLSLYACEGYTLAEEKGCLVLGWKGKHLIAASSWRC